MEDKSPKKQTRSSKANEEPEKQDSVIESVKETGTENSSEVASEDVEKNDGDEKKEPEKNEENISPEDTNEQESKNDGEKSRGVKRKADTLSDIDTNPEQKENQEENIETQTNENGISPNESQESPPKSGSEVMGKGKRARIPNKRYSDILLSNIRKPLTQSKSSDGELEEITIKEEPSDSPIGSPSLQTRRPRQATPNLQDPKFLKPFKYGWKRELVWRSTSTTSKPIGDIYYYTPTGKKVRSSRELVEHLNNKNLSSENFTFFKEALGVDDPEKEIIRDAKVKAAEITIDLSGPAAKKVDVVKKVRKLSPKRDSPQTAKSEDKPTRTKHEAPAKTVTPASPKKTKILPKKNKTPMQKKAAKPPPTPEEPMEVETTPIRAASKPKAANLALAAKKRNLKLKSFTHTNSVSSEEKSETRFMENYLQNLSFGYNTLLYVFQYLKVQDLLRAGCVCTMWRDIASHPILWRTVRMKNSQVHSFEGLASTLEKHGTVHLDLRKMLLPNAGDEIWPEFSKAIERVDTLRKIELCRCPASVVEHLAVTNPKLEVINAVTIKCASMDLNPLNSLKNIKELRLKSILGLKISSIDSLKELKTLRHLSLTSVTELRRLNLDVIAELTNLESLDLGECKDFPKSFGLDVLTKLENLEKLRLEKGQGNCHTFEILEAVKDMPKLEQLELVNFDIKTGFDKALGGCQNIKKLMIIPTYISQSATTNNMVLSGVLRLRGNLSHFVWGVTLELLRVTELFVDQCEEPKDKKEKRPTGNGDSIPVLKPVPDLTHSNEIQAASNPPQVEILPLPNLQKLLLNSLPTTRVKILKIPFHATWRQTLTDSV